MEWRVIENCANLRDNAREKKEKIIIKIISSLLNSNNNNNNSMATCDSPNESEGLKLTLR